MSLGVQESWWGIGGYRRGRDTRKLVTASFGRGGFGSSRLGSRGTKIIEPLNK